MKRENIIILILTISHAKYWKKTSLFIGKFSGLMLPNSLHIIFKAKLEGIAMPNLLLKWSSMNVL